MINVCDSLNTSFPNQNLLYQFVLLILPCSKFEQDIHIRNDNLRYIYCSFLLQLPLTQSGMRLYICLELIQFFISAYSFFVLLLVLTLIPFDHFTSECYKHMKKLRIYPFRDRCYPYSPKYDSRT